MKKILVVCTGNSCRSAMAEGMLRNFANEGYPIKASSAGTNTYNGMFPTEYAVSSMQELGIDISSHRGQQLTPHLIDDADIILAMTQYHREYILRHSSDIEKTRQKTFLLGSFDPDAVNLDVKDPIGGVISDYRECRDKIKILLELFLVNMDIKKDA